MFSKICCLVFVIAFPIQYTEAQEFDTEAWPEINLYGRHKKVTFMRLAAGITKSNEFSNATGGFLEADVQIGLKAIVRTKLLKHPDADKGKLLTFRAGYAYVPSFEEIDPPLEHRGILEVTPRYPVFWDLLLSNRNRLDFRWIDGEYSTRYRNRLKAEREFTIGRLNFNQYGSAEFFYDTRSHSWARHEYAVGTEFPFRKRYVLELYYMLQNNRRANAINVNGIGWVFQMYFGD